MDVPRTGQLRTVRNIKPDRFVEKIVAEAANRKYLGVTTMYRDDQGRYVNLVEELQNNSTKVNYEYSDDTMESYNLPVN